jgi:MoaA/NifB/PqqE/SkfB family radical SAM enzyme
MMMEMTSQLNHYCARFIQELALMTGGSFSRPTDVIVILTNRCNARCIHCHSWKLRPSAHELSEDEWVRGLKAIRSWIGPVALVITGGETLVRGDAIRIAGAAVRLGFATELLTNGFLLKGGKVEELLRSGIRRATLSLDGPNAEIHDQVRGRPGFFANVVAAMENLSKLRGRMNPAIKVVAKTTIMRLNAAVLGAIVELAERIGIDGVQFQALEPVYYSDQLQDPNWFQNNPMWITDLDPLRRSIDTLREYKLRGLPVNNSLAELDLIQRYFEAPAEHAYRVHSHDAKRPRKACRSFATHLQIMPDGGMKMCHWMEPFANLRHGNLKDAWRRRPRCWKNDCGHI